MSKKKKTLLGIGIAVLLIGTLGVTYLLRTLNKIDTEEIAEEEIIIDEQVVEEGYTNVAIFGIDSREGELEKGTRSDCLIVASLNNATKEIRMVSVYRDTILDVEENYLQKCNAAYSFGGPIQAINMLNRNLDLDIRDYVTVDFAAVANVIDLLGGIEIDVKEEEIYTLNKYVYETARVAGKDANQVMSAGVQLLDGVQATTYARIRSTAGGDFTRTERQRLVIEKIVEKAQKSDLSTITKIINEVFPTIKTSFGVTEILSYAKDFAKYKLGETTGFPLEKTTATIGSLGSIVIPLSLESNVNLLHAFLYDIEDYEPTITVQEISNAIVNKVGQHEVTENDILEQQPEVEIGEDAGQEEIPEEGSPEEEIPEEEPPVDLPEDDVQIPEEIPNDITDSGNSINN